MAPFRLMRLYLAAVVLVGCFWYVVYQRTAVDEFFTFSPWSVILSRGHNHCPERRDFEIPPNLGDPCTEGEASVDLQSRLTGPFFCPEDGEAYYTRYPLFNALVSSVPKLVISPLTLRDVQISLRLAKQQNLTVTVRNGGHNPAGFAVSEGGLVIDMSYFNDVQYVDEVLPDDCSAAWVSRFPSKAILAQGGALWRDVHPLLDERGLSVVGGGCPTVGVVGLALGGGVGWNSRHRGLVSDNLLSLRLVLPNGEIRIVDDQTDKRLMHALRGAGGSNFGVVTDVILETFPAFPTYVAGEFDLQRGPDAAERMINVYAALFLNGNADRRLTIDLFLSRELLDHPTDNSIKIGLSFGVFFDGPIKDGIDALRPLLEFLAGEVTTAEACRMYGSQCSSPDEMEQARRLMQNWVLAGGPFLHNFKFTQWLKQYGVKQAATYWISGFATQWTNDTSQTLMNKLKYSGIDRVSTGMKAYLLASIEQMGGQIGQGPSLWKCEEATVLLSIQTTLHPITSRAPSSQRLMTLDSLKRWTESSYHAMEGLFVGSYANYAYPELQDWQEKYYGEEAYAELVKIKQQIPDAEIFDSPQRIQLQTVQPSRPEAEQHGLTAESFRLARSALKSGRSDLCPDWLLSTAVPLGLYDVSLHAPAAPLQLKDGIRIEALVGRNAVVVDGTRGIGFALTLHLLRLGVNVVATSESTKRCRQGTTVLTEILSHLDMAQTGTFLCLSVSLDDVDSIGHMVEELSVTLRDGAQIDMSVLNTGHDGTAGWAQNMAGISKAVAVNHLGPLYLALLLMKREMLNVQSGRIVVQSSQAAFATQLEDLIQLTEDREGQDAAANGQVFSDVAGSESLEDDPTFLTYAATEALSIACGLELVQRLRSSTALEGLRVLVAMPPGTVWTHPTKRAMSNPLYREDILQSGSLLSPAEGALSAVYASVMDLDQLDNPPVSEYVAKEDLSETGAWDETQAYGRRLQWEYGQRGGILRYVLGCQVGSIHARYRNVPWMQREQTCRFWNWTIDTLDTASEGALLSSEKLADLKDLLQKGCSSVN